MSYKNSENMPHELITKDVLIKYFSRGYKGKNELLYIYYYEHFVQSPPRFRILSDKINEELSISISYIDLQSIKVRYKSRPSILEEVAHQKLLDRKSVV